MTTESPPTSPTLDGDPLFDETLGLVRQMSSAHLKEQCLRTEWASLEKQEDRDLLAHVVREPDFWEEVKEMTLSDVEAIPEEEEGADQDSRLKQMFKAFDKDNSGTIDANELHQMMLYMGITTTDAEVRQMIASVDENGDGDIDEEEFLLVMKKAQQSHVVPKPK